jgi:hypothetical protein
LKLEEIYKLAVQMGIEKDPRGKAEIKRLLAKNREKYEKLPEKEKQYFDVSGLDNPFPDSRILVGEPKAEIKAVLVGIDMEVPEVLLADRLREKGEAVDLIISHHPEGQGLINLDKVMALQADEWYRHGVPINIGEALINKRMQEIYRAFLPRNVERALDVARLLDIPFMSMHTVADNQVHSFLSDLFTRKKPHTVGDVIDLLMDIPGCSPYPVRSRSHRGGQGQPGRQGHGGHDRRHGRSSGGAGEAGGSGSRDHRGHALFREAQGRSGEAEDKRDHRRAYRIGFPGHEPDPRPTGGERCAHPARFGTGEGFASQQERGTRQELSRRSRRQGASLA